MQCRRTKIEDEIDQSVELALLQHDMSDEAVDRMLGLLHILEQQIFCFVAGDRQAVNIGAGVAVPNRPSFDGILVRSQSQAFELFNEVESAL